MQKSSLALVQLLRYPISKELPPKVGKTLVVLFDSRSFNFLLLLTFGMVFFFKEISHHTTDQKYFASSSFRIEYFDNSNVIFENVKKQNKNSDDTFSTFFLL